MSDSNKTMREWTLKDHGDGGICALGPQVKVDERVRVIEYSALIEAQAEIADLIVENKRLLDQLTGAGILQKNYVDSVTKIKRLGSDLKNLGSSGMILDDERGWINPLEEENKKLKADAEASNREIQVLKKMLVTASDKVLPLINREAELQSKVDSLDKEVIITLPDVPTKYEIKITNESSRNVTIRSGTHIDVCDHEKLRTELERLQEVNKQLQDLPRVPSLENHLRMTKDLNRLKKQVNILRNACFRVFQDDMEDKSNYHIMVDHFKDTVELALKASNELEKK